MNDRFKFRVWFEERFIYKSLCDSNVYTEDDKCICLANNLPDLPWEQCTGLKDKNGKLIYEGDIVTDGFNTFVVEWYKEMAQFVARFRDEKHLYTVFYPDDANTKYEVLGNIHEGKKKHAK